MTPAATSAGARSGRGLGVLSLVETCPGCNGEPKRPTFFGRSLEERLDDEGNYLPSSGCVVTWRTCPLCDGEGAIPRGRGSWVTLGTRLRTYRETNLIGWTRDGERLVYTVDPKVPLRPEPMELAAHHHGISVRQLEAIEAGLMDPRCIARTLRWVL